MNEKETGGSAFPHMIGQDLVYTGMTLRDYFAGQALSAMNSSFSYKGIERDLFKIAETAYEVADAMLKEREKNDCDG